MRFVCAISLLTVLALSGAWAQDTESGRDAGAAEFNDRKVRELRGKLLKVAER